MKTIKTKKLVLDNAALEEEFFEDVMLIGIVSPLEPHQLIWRIQKATGFLFNRNPEHDIEINGLFFPIYQFNEKGKFIEHIIYTNRKKTDFLLPEARNTDFIWMLKGSLQHAGYESMIPSIIQQINRVDHSFIINPAHLKNRQYLIL
ncbi:MAG: IPExxxVDY family protein [Chitinophagaceae bacterium]|nr:IPExxxVDY family protein [Chitinophagaceae bacterium]